MSLKITTADLVYRARPASAEAKTINTTLAVASPHERSRGSQCSTTVEAHVSTQTLDRAATRITLNCRPICRTAHAPHDSYHYCNAYTGLIGHVYERK